MRYHPLRWYNVGRLNNRTHRKLLIVDGRIGFTGGVGDRGQLAGSRGIPITGATRTTARGPRGGLHAGAFVDNWMETCGEVLHGEEYFPPLEPVGSHRAAFRTRTAAAARA